MDAVKNFFECFNYHWIIIVVTGIYIHLRQICIIGLCFDEELILPFDPSYASVLFIFSVLCLLAEYRLWPRSLKEPPVQLMIVYEMMVSSLVTNLATRAIWVPLLHAIWCMTQESSRWLEWLNDILGLDQYSLLNSLASYMCDDMAAFHTAFCLSLLSFVWMLDATESLDGILDIWTKDEEFFPRYKERASGDREYDSDDPDCLIHKCQNLVYEGIDEYENLCLRETPS